MALQKSYAFSYLSSQFMEMSENFTDASRLRDHIFILANNDVTSSRSITVFFVVFGGEIRIGARSSVGCAQLSA
jgi:hypothetical protein